VRRTPGSVTSTAPGVWRVVVAAGTDDDGRRRQVSRRVRGDRSEAEAVRRALVDEFASEIEPEPGPGTVRQVGPRVRGSVRPTDEGSWAVVVDAERTADGRRRQVRRIIRGDRELAELWRDHLVELYAPKPRAAAPRTRPRRRRAATRRRPAPTRSVRRFDLAPLLAEYSVGRLAEIVGVDRGTVHRWSRSGLDEHRADEVAIAVGLHPALIWPEWLYEAASSGN